MADKSITLVGMDFEASGSDPWEGSAPIEIGLAIGTEDHETYPEHTFESRIGGWLWDFEQGSWIWSHEAYQVHKIGSDELEKAAPVYLVDRMAAGWLGAYASTSRMWTIPVGWNVAGYDRQFISRHFPLTNKLLSYRSIDLGALCFYLANGDVKEYNKIKKASKRYAELKLGEAGWHGALFDAKAALWSYEFLLQARYEAHRG